MPFVPGRRAQLWQPPPALQFDESAAPRPADLQPKPCPPAPAPQGFYSRNGPAFLFDSCINVVLGEVEEREMTTGRHQVRGLYCLSCNWLLGWRYGERGV